MMDMIHLWDLYPLISSRNVYGHITLSNQSPIQQKKRSQVKASNGLEMQVQAPMQNRSKRNSSRS